MNCVARSNVKSLYIHIPFCESICSYCDFCKMFYREELAFHYLQKLEEEILERYRGEVLDTIYIGGGTPSCLSPANLRYLFSIVSKLNKSANLEFTIEANISDIDEEFLKMCKSSGVNRISIGIQTINEKFYKFLNRYNDINSILDKIELTKKYFTNINVDFMYGFRDETMDDLKKDLDFFKSLDVEHISIYSLILEENTKLYIDKTRPIDEDLESDMYYYIVDYLESNGYRQYEISNFAKPSYESHHNLSYWNNLEYYGFGLGASGYIDGVRYTNTRGINNYLRGNYVLEQYEVSDREAKEMEVILALRKREGLEISKFFDKYKVAVFDIFDIMKLVDDNMLEMDDRFIRIPKDKLYVSNRIMVCFLGGSNE